MAPAVRAYDETHLDEVTAPLLGAISARRTEIDSLPAPTKAEKTERKRLLPILARLSKPSRRRAHDFAELVAGAQAVRKLGELGLGYTDEVDDGFTRAGIALTEREELLLDHRGLLVTGKDVTRLDKALAKSAAFRAAAAAEIRTDRRARALQAAEAVLATALKKAERAVRRAGRPLPPARYRSGDVMGPGGGRIAIPRDAATPLAGASIVFGANAVNSPTPVSLAEGTTIVDGSDTPAGPALAVSPDGLSLSGIAEISLPYLLPPDTVATDLTLFRRVGGTTSALPGTAAGADGFATATSLALGTFQPGVAAPPVGAPDGIYRVQMLALTSAAGTTSTVPSFDPGVSGGFLSQDYTFRRNGTGATALGSSQGMSRTFLADPPHHDDAHSTTVAGSVEFTWTAPSVNRFSFGLPLSLPAGTTIVPAEGTVSDDGRVLVFSGRTTSFEFFAVGLRAARASRPADLDELAGRWVAAEIGISFENGGEEPFSTIWTDRFRTFTAAADGSLTYDSTGAAFATEISYATDQGIPAHSLTSSSAADGGTETLTVFADGVVQDTGLTRFGQFDPVKGVLALRRFETAGDGGKRRAMSLMIAARQPTPAAAGVFEGTWNTHVLESGFAIGPPDALSSHQEIGAALGTITVGAGGDAAASFPTGGAEQQSLRGVRTGGAMSWTLTSAVAASFLPTLDATFTVTPDASGNHTPDPAAAPNYYWFGASGDGSVLLGARTTAEFLPGAHGRGILIGLE